MSDEDDSARIDQLEAAGICVICEEVAAQRDDIMCIECRDYTTAISDRVRDPIEGLLSQHQALRWTGVGDGDLVTCFCFKSFRGPAHHRRHVAELIYDALGLNGPEPWTLGPLSPNREVFPDFPVSES